MYLSCTRVRLADIATYIAIESKAIISIRPHKLYNILTRNELLKLNYINKIFESEEFKDLIANTIDDPVATGIAWSSPAILVMGKIEDKDFTYLILDLSDRKKFSAWLVKNNLQNFRDFERFKVQVLGQIALAWDQSKVIIGQSRYMPDLLQSILLDYGKEGRWNNRSLLEQINFKEMISGAFSPGIWHYWHEQTDRLSYCGLQIEEVDQQSISFSINSSKQKCTIRIGFHYSNSWDYFWKAFFNQREAKVLMPAFETKDSFSLWTSQLDLNKIDLIAHSECPINLLDPYLSIPQQKIIKKIIHCLDGLFGIYLPDTETNPDNHILFFKTPYPQHVQHILEEELKTHLGDNEIRTQIDFDQDNDQVIYYSVRDSFLILSKKALNLLKIDDKIEAFKFHLSEPSFSQGAFFLHDHHLKYILSIDGFQDLPKLEVVGGTGNNILEINILNRNSDHHVLSIVINWLDLLFSEKNTRQIKLPESRKVEVYL